MEKELKNEFKKAIEHFNVVANVNGAIEKYHTETEKTTALVGMFNKETKFAGALIYSAPLKIVLKSAGSKKNLIYDLKINKMEIRYFLDKKQGDEFYGFKLGMALLSSYNEHYLKSIMTFFTIAATKDYNEFHIVCDGDRRKIRDSESHYVQFSNMDDFYEIVSLCLNVIAEFDKQLSGDGKLLLHMEMQ